MFKLCSQLQLLNINKKSNQPKSKIKRKKMTLLDKEKRRKFLRGFRKRELERERKVQKQLQQQLKEEIKKFEREMRKERKKRYKKSLSNQVVPELEELLSQQEFNLGSHTVSVLELNVADLKEEKKWIGENKIVEEKEQENNKSCNDNNGDEIVGMSLQEKCKNQVQPKSKSNRHETKFEKKLNQEIKKALKRIKKDKIFEQKQRLEQKNKKQSKQKLHIKKAQGIVHKHDKRSKKKCRRCEICCEILNKYIL